MTITPHVLHFRSQSVACCKVKTENNNIPCCLVWQTRSTLHVGNVRNIMEYFLTFEGKFNPHHVDYYCGVYFHWLPLDLDYLEAQIFL